MSKLLEFAVLLTCALLAFTDLQYAPHFALYPIFAAAGIGALAGLSRRELGPKVLGCGVLVLPFFSFQGLNLFASAWLFCRALRNAFDRGEEGDSMPNRRAETELAFLLFVFSLCIAGIRAWRFGYDSLLFNDLIASAGRRGLLWYLIQNPRLWTSVPLLCSGYVLAGLVFTELGQKKDAKQFFDGLALGAIASALVVFGQLLQLRPELSFNRGAFWQMTGRYPGLGSDPNAFGVTAGLLVPAFLLFGSKLRPLYYLAALLLLITAPWSGSRTFWAAGFLCVGYLLWRRFAARSRGLAVTMVCGGLGVLLLAGMPPINRSLQKIVPAPGVSRVLETLNWESSGEMLSSRTKFAQIALEVWREAPLLGVGLGRFYVHEAGAAKRAGIELGEWRDNANSFYLQLLSENGLLGILLVGISFVLLLRSLREEGAGSADTQSARFLAGLFLLLLITGPHLLFDELKYIFAGILALGVSSAAEDLSSRERSRAAHLVIRGAALATICAVLFFVHTGKGSPLEGVYPREYGADGAFFWTAKTARIALCPAQKNAVQKNEVRLEVKALNPDLAVTPLELTVVSDGSGGEQSKRVTLTQPVWTEIQLPLESPWPEDKPFHLELRSARTWSPAGGSYRGDARWLGVMVKYPENLCPELRDSAY